jgi:hypothetical protein
MGCSSSKSVDSFRDFDRHFARAVSSVKERPPTIRLLDATFLRMGGLKTLARRQELEARDLQEPIIKGEGFKRDQKIYLTPTEAVAAVRTARRRVCLLTHSWRTAVHPDPGNATLTALQRFLRHPLGHHITGVFVDFACVHQHPRTSEQEASFQEALGVMAHAFASPLGTCVARFAVIPPASLRIDLDAVIAVRGPGEAAGATVRAALAAGGCSSFSAMTSDVGSLRTVLKLEWKTNAWRAEMGSAAEAREAIEAIEAAGAGMLATRWYNDRPYAQRGWCTLEAAA